MLRSIQAQASALSARALFSTSRANSVDAYKLDSNLQKKDGTRGEMLETLLSIQATLDKKPQASSPLIPPGAFPTVSDFPVHSIPRTGVRAGRTVAVPNTPMLGRALRQLDLVNNKNKVRETWRNQKYYIRPAKQRLRKREERYKRELRTGVRELFQLVALARRKGY
jgi:ribosomal protein S21